MQIRLNNLEAWLSEVIDEQQFSGGMTIRLTIETQDTLNSFDPEELRRAVINIIDNAKQAKVGQRQRSEKRC